MTKAPPLGVSSACLGEDFSPASLPLLAAAGFSHLEFAAFRSPQLCALPTVELLGRQVRASGLVAWSLHAPFGQACNLADDDESRRRQALATMTTAFDQAATFGAHLVIAHSGYYDPQREPRETALLRAVRSYNELAKRASQRGLRLAIEYLPPKPGNLGASAEELLWLQRLIDGDVFFCADTNHMNLRGQTAEEELGRLAPGLHTTHLSDNDGVQEQHWLPGSGVIDWSAVGAALTAGGYAGPWLLEAGNFPAADPADRIRQLAEAARALYAG